MIRLGQGPPPSNNKTIWLHNLWKLPDNHCIYLLVGHVICLCNPSELPDFWLSESYIITFWQITWPAYLTHQNHLISSYQNHMYSFFWQNMDLSKISKKGKKKNFLCSRKKYKNFLFWKFYPPKSHMTCLYKPSNISKKGNFKFICQKMLT
jgi:hypothetical protein